MFLKPYKFRPSLKKVLWGGERIAAFKGIYTDERQIGESWEVSPIAERESVVAGGPDDGLTLSQLVERHRQALVGNEVYQKFGTHFPLLIKLIDAKHDLSLQVHPGDEMAQRLHDSHGKTEMWYVVDAKPDAQIVAGFERPITRDEFDQHISDGTIMDAVATFNTHPGDVFLLPPGCIHAIGAGNLIVEVQQPSDITYRVHDYNRLQSNGQLRPLHIDLAKKALDYSLCGNRTQLNATISSDETVLASCDYFVVRKMSVNGQEALVLPDHFMVILCLDGKLEVIDNHASVTSLRQGETILVPAQITELTFRGSATIITITLP